MSIFVRRVPAKERSRYLAAALAEKLGDRERRLIAACEIANRDPDLLAIEREFDALPAEIPEHWNPPRANPPLTVPVQCGGRSAVAAIDQIRVVSKARLDRRG